MVCFQGVVLPHTPPYNSLRRSPVYIFYRSMGFFRPQVTYYRFFRPMDELSVRERARLPLPAEWGLPQANSPPNFFRRAEGAAMSAILLMVVVKRRNPARKNHRKDV